MSVLSVEHFQHGPDGFILSGDSAFLACETGWRLPGSADLHQVLSHLPNLEELVLEHPDLSVEQCSDVSVGW